jgi:hypothetical protein
MKHTCNIIKVSISKTEVEDKKKKTNKQVSKFYILLSNFRGTAPSPRRKN